MTELIDLTQLITSGIVFATYIMTGGNPSDLINCDPEYLKYSVKLIALES